MSVRIRFAISSGIRVRLMGSRSARPASGAGAPRPAFLTGCFSGDRLPTTGRTTGTVYHTPFLWDPPPGGLIRLKPDPNDPVLSMTPAIVEFTARGSARAVSAAIEAYAGERRVVTALVVPWESDAATLRMAVTATKSDGWAIEHTNLGTISLADLGGERTRVAVLAAPAGDDAKDAHPANRELDLQ